MDNDSIPKTNWKRETTKAQSVFDIRLETIIETKWSILCIPLSPNRIDGDCDKRTHKANKEREEVGEISERSDRANFLEKDHNYVYNLYEFINCRKIKWHTTTRTMPTKRDMHVLLIIHAVRCNYKT